MHRYEHSSRIAADYGKLARRCEHCAKNAKKTPSKNLAGVTTSCASNTPRIDVAARSRLRVGFRGCRQRGKLGSFRWKSLLADLFAGGREAARADEAQTFRAQAWDTFFDATRLNLCQSAVRAGLKHDVKLGKVLAVFVSRRQVERL